MDHRRGVAGAALLVLQLAASPIGGEAQQADNCNGRASLRIAVRDESGSVAIPNATVLLRWTESEAVRRPVRQVTQSDGRLFLCAPGETRQATLWAEFADASSGEAVVTLEPGVTREVELRLLVSSGRTGRLIGQIRDARTEDPVAAAAVSLAGRPETVQTNRRGRFIMSGVPVGVYELSVRHLGYAPLSHPISVSLGMTTDVEVGLVPDPVEMEPLVATATRVRRLEIKGFYERKYWGEMVSGGTFYTAADIERRRPVLISHMISDESGIKLTCGMRRSKCRLVNTRRSVGFANEDCVMSIYLDGSWINRNPRDTIDDFVIPVEIAGLEIYKGAASLPAEFGGYASGCGVVVIWTK